MASNILISIESFYDGGAEMFAIRLSNAMAEKHNIYFLELEPFRTKVKSQLKLLNTQKVVLLQPGIKSPLGKLLHSGLLDKRVVGRLKPLITKYYEKAKNREIRKFFLKNKIDTVNSHCWGTDYFFSYFKKEMNFNLIFSLHGHYELFDSIEAIADFKNKTIFSLSQADNIVYTTKTHLETLNKYSDVQHKCSQIYYGFDFKPVNIPTTYDGKKLKVLLVARGLPEKGWEQLIMAVNNLLLIKPNSVVLDLVGDSKYVYELKVRYQSENIIFHGHQDNVVPFIQDSHICALPSYFVAESLPNSIIEYVSCGKPVISTDVGSIRDMITVDGDTAGTIIKLRNGLPDVNELMEAIEVYLNEPDMVAKHSRLSIKAAKKFSISDCVAKYLDVFKS